jgi:tRNA modification GTPase
MPKPSPDDTIAAISTPLGSGGIAVVRISGESALSIADRVFASDGGKPLSRQQSHTVAVGWARDPRSGKSIDRCLATVFRSPAGYTGEDTVEISCHGGALVAKGVLDALLAAGARPAEPGEFTKRAFLAGKLDLAQAEAVAALIEAKTEKARALASLQLEGRLSERVGSVRESLLNAASALEAELDSPDDVEPADRRAVLLAMETARDEIASLAQGADAGISVREGASCVIVGRTNVGKSTAMNTLLGRDRVIVSPEAGTTRDVVDALVDISGVAVRLADTAGFGAEVGEMERLGSERARAELAAADLAVFVLDGSETLSQEDEKIASLVGGKPVVLVLNKTDLPQALALGSLRDLRLEQVKGVVRTSLLTGEGVEALERTLADALLGSSGLDTEGAEVHVIESRHKEALGRAQRAARSAIRGLRAKGPIDIVSDDVRSAASALGEITGETASEEIIDRIFERFCVGK